MTKILPSWAKEFTLFAFVGVLGFIANVASMLVLAQLTNLYVTGFLAWVIAATATWYFNRLWTFAKSDYAPVWRQWLQFLAANSLGLALYYTTYALMIYFSAWCAAYPIVAVAGGSIAGLFINYSISRKFVFR